VHELQLGGQHVLVGLELHEDIAAVHLRDIHSGGQADAIVGVRPVPLQIGQGLAQIHGQEAVRILLVERRVGAVPAPGLEGPLVPDPVVVSAYPLLDDLAGVAEPGASGDDLAQDLQTGGDGLVHVQEGVLGIGLALECVQAEGLLNAFVQVPAQAVADPQCEDRLVPGQDPVVPVQDPAPHGLEQLGAAPLVLELGDLVLDGCACAELKLGESCDDRHEQDEAADCKDPDA